MSAMLRRRCIKVIATIGGCSNGQAFNGCVVVLAAVLHIIHERLSKNGLIQWHLEGCADDCDWSFAPI